MMSSRSLRLVLPALLLAVLFAVGGWALGPLPPLGPLLDPANGVWAVAAAADLPRAQSASIAGLESPVQVIFDHRGVPHVFARSENDAYRAMGYVVARDRLFQMEIQTRAAAGRLSEWLGPRGLTLDRSSRRLGLPWGAERKFAALDTLSPGYRAVVAYSEGVNAWIDAMRPRDLPIEYRLLNVRPLRWQPQFTQYFFVQMGLTLAFNDASLTRQEVASVVGSSAADALFPVNSPIQEPIQPNGRTSPRYDFRPIPPPGPPGSFPLARHSDQRSGTDGDGLGSNNWAVAPARTANHFALLAGDPHLTLTLPSIWYEAHLSVPGVLDVAGVGFPGAPGIIIGFNRDLAWSFTNTSSDVNDYYLETVDDADHPTRYRLDGRWKPLERRIEVYRGRGGEVLASDTLLFTHRGPMNRQDGRWLSMHWTVFDPSRESGIFLQIQHAHSAAEWLHQMENFSAPTQNGLVADRSGTIAIRSSGRYPRRPGDGRGDVIRDGSSSASDWIGDLPLAQYPSGLNPPQGFLASANQQPVDPRVSSVYLGSDWYAPWRAMRINTLLRADSQVTPDAMRRYQTDPGSPRADALVPRFLQAADLAERNGSSDPELRRAAAILRSWDHRYTSDNRAAGLFELAMEELVERTWDELGTGRGRLPGSSILLELMQTPKSPWWDDHRTAPVEDRDAILIASLRAAMTRARAQFGPPGDSGWSWSGIRHANIYHLLHIPAFSVLGIPMQGGPSTLNPSSGDGTEGASWRMVVELGPEVHAWGAYPGGQSGNPVSPRYQDRLPAWKEGRLDSLAFPRTPQDLGVGDSRSTLTLLPSP